MRLCIRYSAVAALNSIVLILLASGCGTGYAGQQPDATAPSLAKLTVVTTVYPVTYFTQRIGADFVTVTSLVAAGVEAHDFEPTPSDLRTVSEAKLVVYAHPSFEVWMADALKSITGVASVIASDMAPGEVNEEGEGEDGHDHDGTDPHVWLSMDDAEVMVGRIRDALTSVEPGHAGVFALNASAVIAELEDLRARFESGLASCALNTIVVSHEGYGHLAELFGFEQLGLARLSPEVESSAKRIADISTRMGELGIRHILVEPIISSRLAEAVAADTGAALLPLHPLESLTRAEVTAGDDYFKVMDRNLESLKMALECG